MSHSPVKPGGWTANEKYSSSQANDLQDILMDSVDKTTAGDTVSGELEFASTGGITMLNGSELIANTGSTVSISGDFEIGNSANAQMDLSGSSYIILGNGTYISTSGTGHIQLNNNTWPLLNARTRSILKAFGETTYRITGSSSWTNYQYGVRGPGSSAEAIGVILPHHNNARLTSIDIYFTPAVHAGLPGTPPQLAIADYSADGFIGSLQSHPFTLPGSVVSYSNVDQVWSITLSPTITLATAGSFIYIKLYDEDGANAVSNNFYKSIKFNFDNITDMRFP